MQISRRGLILGGSALLASCSSSATTLPITGVSTPSLSALPNVQSVPHVRMGGPVIDPHNIIRRDLLERAHAALDTHGSRIAQRDRLYIVDFQKFSGEDRLYEVDLEGGWVTSYRTSHGRGSDPAHSGFAQRFSNETNSHMSSIGAYATAGANWGSQQGPNVLLDGLEYSNSRARERAIIIHGADYADPSFLAREGKLGRSYGCFSVSHADLKPLRERMGEGRLLFAMT